MGQILDAPCCQHHDHDNGFTQRETSIDSSSEGCCESRQMPVISGALFSPIDVHLAVLSAPVALPEREQLAPWQSHVQQPSRQGEPRQPRAPPRRNQRASIGIYLI